MVRTPSKTVVSLTTIPSRFDGLGQTLNSLLGQVPRPDAIEVTIPRRYRRFPDHEFRLPDVPEGVDVIVVEEDYGPASKILPCVRRYQGTDTRIVYCDDDRIAPQGWLKALLAASDQHPDCAIAVAGVDWQGIVNQRRPRALLRKGVDLGYRLRRARHLLGSLVPGEKAPKPARLLFGTSGYVDIAEGLGGVLVRPAFFDEASFDIPSHLWAVDDFWLSGSLERNGIGIWVPKEGLRPTGHAGDTRDALVNQVIEGMDRRQANTACVQYMQETFGIWL